jgi:hypothetical protein
LSFIEKASLFGDLPELEPPELLQAILVENIPLAIAIGTEKARSELIVAPILVALRKYFNNQISLFSGVEFNVDFTQGLNGVCDFIISRSQQQLFMQSPVVALVEAKNDHLKSGLAQCLGEAIAAQIFNQRQGNETETVYGAVTTGTAWQFISLQAQNVKIDLTEYPLQDSRQNLRHFIKFY